MRHAKRPSYLFFSLNERPLVDIGALLRGEVSLSAESQILALSILTASCHTVTRPEFELLHGLSSRRWSLVSDLERHGALRGIQLKDLVAKGLVLSDGDDPLATSLRRREEVLTAHHWHPYAAFYHFMSRESEDSLQGDAEPVDMEVVSANASADAAEFVRKYGPPPDPFLRIGTQEKRLELPFVERGGSLYDLLRRRKTVRAFDQHRSMKLEDLATLLRYVFGCHGFIELSEEVTLLHKTSPSGGSLHPIEAYPLVLNVEGVAAGLYHYDVASHSLELIRLLKLDEARQLASELSYDQMYAGSAHAVVLLTARFDRNQWKYRRRSKTYGVILMDLGHLSQTFYLVAADLGLGAFYTAAIRAQRIEEELGLEPGREGAIGVCGCGLRSGEGSELGLDFQPFVPRRIAP